jgi:hypothetical protein
MSKRKVDKAKASMATMVEDLTGNLASETADQRKAVVSALHKRAAKRVMANAAKNAKTRVPKECTAVKKQQAKAGVKAPIGANKKLRVTAVPTAYKRTKTDIPTNQQQEETSEESDGEHEVPHDDIVVKVVVKKKRKPDGLQLESAASRANCRAGVGEVPCDEFGCAHMGIEDIILYGGIHTVSWMKHHLVEGGYLDGEHCAECGKPSEDIPLTKTKGNNNLCYICQVGTRPRDESEKCNIFFCPGCVCVRVARLEEWKKAKAIELGGESSKRTSSRRKLAG